MVKERWPKPAVIWQRLKTRLQLSPSPGAPFGTIPFRTQRACAYRAPSVASLPFDLNQSLGVPLTITDAGLRVLEDRDDHIRLNGIDRWVGGVHLNGPEAAWRWDPGTMQIRSSLA